jgi:crossover junction endodeoxyribonuclease RuvC
VSVVVGIDSSLTLSGCASVRFGDQPVRWETWRARAPQPSTSTVAGERRRLRTMLREILAYIPEHVDLVVVEGPAPSAKFSGKADERSGLRWMVIDQLLPRTPNGDGVVLVDPQTRAVLAFGKGMPRRKKGQSSDAAKAPVLERVRADFPDAHVPDHNVADAVALAAAGAHHLGMPVDYSAAQSSALAKVAWPVGEPLLAGMKG